VTFTTNHSQRLQSRCCANGCGRLKSGGEALMGEALMGEDDRQVA